MPDRRQHRGRHPEDDRLFGSAAHASLQAATADLSWLLDRAYAETSALKLVGDRYRLAARQRMAVLRAAASEAACRQRAAKRCDVSQVRGQPLLIDGYNVLITLESALSGGVLLGSRDGCLRDLASLHGTYRTVEETKPGILLAGQYLETVGPESVVWYLDTPVSNSGRLAAIIRAMARDASWNWQVELVPNPDTLLAGSGAIVASSDSWILDHCQRWFNLAHDLLMHTPSGERVLWLR